MIRSRRATAAQASARTDAEVAGRDEFAQPRRTQARENAGFGAAAERALAPASR